MSKKKNKCCCEKRRDDCCCEMTRNDCCCSNNNSGTGFLGGGCGVAPIIFLLIAFGSGLLNCSSSYLIILLFILFGGCFFNMGNNSNTCC